MVRVKMTVQEAMELRKKEMARKKAPISKKTFTGNASSSKNLKKPSLPDGVRRHSTRVTKKFEPFTIPLPIRKITVVVRQRKKVKKPEKVKPKSVKRADRSVVGASKARGVKKPSKAEQRKTKEVVSRKRKAQPAEPKRKKHKNDALVPRLDLDDYQANPYFYAKKPPKFVSVSSYGRVAHRFVLRKDLNELRRVVEDKEHFCSDALTWTFSHESEFSPEAVAVIMEDRKLIDGVVALLEKLETAEWKKDRANVETVLLSQQGTGQKNVHMLGHNTAAVEMTRGGREGINALVNYNHESFCDVSAFIAAFFERDVSFGTLEHLTSIQRYPYSQLRALYPSQIFVAVRYGNRKLAAKLIETYAKYNFNDLHIQTLANSTQPLKKFMPVSVLKKGRDNRNITPLHTAATNPNVSYLKALVAVEPNFNVPDADNWFTIHYAAVCEGPEPLKFIIGKGIPIVLLNKQKDTPLHCAARAGRPENVKVIIAAIRKAEEISQAEEKRDEEEQRAEANGTEDGSQTGTETETEDDEPATVQPPPLRKPKKAKGKRNVALINAKAANGYTPLHFAVEKGHEEVVHILLGERDVDVEAQTSATHKKLTALMIACRKGFRQIADILIDEGMAIVEKGDKLKRTALTHAVMNGQTHIVAMLLRRGASPSLADTSGNTPAHYAAAYGWFECIELLAKADPASLASRNDWHLTPLAVAYLKGHIGIVEWLIDGPFSQHVDVNCRDQSGVTLVSSVLKHYDLISDRQIVDQIDYLISKGADSSLTDTSSNSPLHLFASLNAKLRVEGAQPDDVDVGDNDRRLTKAEYLRCADRFLSAGANFRQNNDNGENCFIIALKSGNLLLAEYLFDKFTDEHLPLYSLDGRENGKAENGNILHLLVELPFKVYNVSEVWARLSGPAGGQYNIVTLLLKLISADQNLVKQWLSEIDDKGRTPFLLLCQNYTRVKTHFTNPDSLDARNKCKANLEQLLYTICAVIRYFASVDPKILLQRIAELNEKPVDEDNPALPNVPVQDSTNEGDRNGRAGTSAITYGLTGNAVHHRVVWSMKCNDEVFTMKNKLLATMVDIAKEKGLLWELLSQRDAEEFTPLLKTVSNGDVGTSLYLMSLRPPPSLRNVCELDAAVVPRRYDPVKKAYVPFNKSVLMFAAEKHLIDVIMGLELSDAEWNACTADGDNAFCFASSFRSWRTTKVFEILKRKGVLVKVSSIASPHMTAYCFDVLFASLCKLPLPTDAPASIPRRHFPLFVTWKKGREKALRGCIGDFTGRVIPDDLLRYTIFSATADPRFDAIKLDEVEHLHCAVSILTNVEIARDYRDWVVGVHGIRIEFQYDLHVRTALFLPYVAVENGWGRTNTLDNLIRKAGYDGLITEVMRMSVQVMRFLSDEVQMSYQEYVAYKKAYGKLLVDETGRHFFAV